MLSRSETIVRALAAVLEAGMPPGTRFMRGGDLPSTIPAAGLAILMDGDPGEPEVLLNPPHYVYEHRAEVDIVVDRATAPDPESAFDAIRVAIGVALGLDRTLGGLCDYVIGVAPVPVEFSVEGAQGLKAATIGIVLTYGSPDPLT